MLRIVLFCSYVLGQPLSRAHPVPFLHRHIGAAGLTRRPARGAAACTWWWNADRKERMNKQTPRSRRRVVRYVPACLPAGRPSSHRSTRDGRVFMWDDGGREKQRQENRFSYVFQPRLSGWAYFACGQGIRTGTERLRRVVDTKNLDF